MNKFKAIVRTVISLSIALTICTAQIFTIAYAVQPVAAAQQTEIQKYYQSDQNLTVGDTPVIICKGVNIVYADVLMTQINSLPDYLIENVNSITLTNQNLATMFNEDLSAYGNVYVKGVSYKQDIWINVMNGNCDTVIHEAFHTFDYAYTFCSTPEFKDCYLSEKDKLITTGYITDIREFFALSGVAYINDADDFKINNPKTYAYFEACTQLKTNENK